MPPGPHPVKCAWLLATVVACASARAATPAAPAASPTPAPLAAASGLAAASFMQGHWIGVQDGALSEEIWTAPVGDSMLGLWRLVADGRARIYELLAISTDPDRGLVLRLRHFDGQLRAREEQDRPLVLHLHHADDGEVAFEGTGSDSVVRLVYRRDGTDGLVAVLERGPRRDEFRYRRRAPAAP